MIYKSLISRVLAVLCLTFFSFSSFAQDADIEAGKTLFRNNCASCHNKNMKQDLTGPALGGVQERWADYPTEDLYSWIRNSQALIAAGHPRANEVWDKWKPVQMQNFLNLSDADIANILGYIQCTYDGNCPGDVVVTNDTPTVGSGDTGGSNNTALFIVLALVLGILAVVLARIASNLNYMIKVKEGNAPARRRTLVEILTSKGVIAFVVFALVVLGGYTTVNNAVFLGRQQGYKPDQPIKFSHATHAGLQQIDCQYCHDGARRSKHSVIPAANTCMNCHKAIEVGSKYGTAELTKIFASIGYDPSTDKYIEDYDNMKEEDIKKVYSKWIADNYIQGGGDAGQVEEVIDEQWKGIETALKNPDNGDEKIAGPIEWIKIHNLPDHVYFNHAQHVSVGKVACQTCHGQVQEMEVVGQYAPLSMGWCINCHRQTEVQFKDNDYYKSYAKYHEELTSGQRDKVTVEEIGGLECQKCHY